MKIIFASLLLSVCSFTLFTSFAQVPLPNQTTSLFSGSGRCATCHTGTGTVLMEDGVDISPTTHWRSSMMGNSSKDPFWRAMVEEEVNTHPQLQEVIENTCTRCHAPIGNRQWRQDGDSTYTMAQLKSDTLANDGISCTVCHQFNDANYGSTSSYTGGYLITNERKIYGPYSNPFANPMINTVNFTPVHSVTIGRSEHCATCHTLFTPTIDYNGQVAGMFPEQTPYLEWKNSRYQNEGIECQTCHMPVTNTPVDIASAPPFNTTLRTPYWKHIFAGGNRLMNTIISQNIPALGVSAQTSHFDTTRFYTEQMLQEKTVHLTIAPSFSSGFLNTEVKVENLSGHKLPTGIPFRRMWIHFKVLDDSGRTVFESGKWDSDGEIVGLDSLYEPHHTVISMPDQVQIYEAILQDVNGNVTLNLLRSAGYKKDNRIPPQGFKSTHISYDTVAIAGDAVNDPDFNRLGSEEGTGADVIVYHVPIQQGVGYTVEAELCYQPLTPRLIHHLSEYNTADIQQFLSMYNPVDHSPAIMKKVVSSVLTNIGTEPAGNPEGFRFYQNYPNPFNPETMIRFSLSAGSFVQLDVYNVLGEKVSELIHEQLTAGEHTVLFRAEALPAGIYFARLSAGGSSDTIRMVLLR